jgi:hypothetical protein
VEYVKNPQEEAQGFRGLLFAQYLGGSVASAMVNMLQPVQVTFPYLSQYGGVAKAAAQMTAPSRDVRKKTTGRRAARRGAEEGRGRGHRQPAGSAPADGAGPGPRRAEVGRRHGGGDASRARPATPQPAVAGVGQGVRRRRAVQPARDLHRGVPHGRRPGHADPAGFAEKAIAETQFVYNKGNKPQWARGAIGSVLFTFKQYSISYVELLHRMATQGGPEGKKAALLALGMLFLFSGAGGLPFADDAEDLVDGVMQRLGYNFSTKLAKKQFFENLLGKELGRFASTAFPGCRACRST